MTDWDEINTEGAQALDWLVAAHVTIVVAAIATMVVFLVFGALPGAIVALVGAVAWVAAFFKADRHAKRHDALLRKHRA